MFKKIPNYDTKLFKEVWETPTEFATDVENSGIPVLFKASTKTTTLNTLFWLLYARHANDPIANLDINQWKYRVYSIIYQYGPTWEKRLEIQQNVRNLTLDELKKGSKAIYNKAFNPSSDPSTDTLDEIEYINEQNTTNYKRADIEAYSIQWDAMKVDVSEVFLRQFDKLFKVFVSHEHPTIYVEEEEDE